jgi:hypothetical protein
VERECHGEGCVENGSERCGANTRSQDSNLEQIKGIDELALHREIDLEWV